MNEKRPRTKLQELADSFEYVPEEGEETPKSSFLSIIGMLVKSIWNTQWYFFVAIGSIIIYMLAYWNKLHNLTKSWGELANTDTSHMERRNPSVWEKPLSWSMTIRYIFGLIIASVAIVIYYELNQEEVRAFFS